MQMVKRMRVRITEQELLCKNKCGFYGTPQWEGFCSKCWRQSQSQQKRKIDHHKNRSLLSEKGDDNADSKTSRFRSILRKSPSMFSPSTSVDSQSVVHSTSSNTLQSFSEIPGVHPRLYSYIFDNFGSTLAKDVDKICRQSLDRVFQNSRLSLDEISEIVQHDYQSIKERISKLNPIRSDFSISIFMGEFEEYLCSNAYDVIFSDRADEEAADLSMQDRIRSLNWVTSGYLETAFDFSILSVHKHVDDAVTYVIDMNQYRSVQEKLDCLVSCSKTIFTALKDSRDGAPASADEFLPGLIYIILRANPPLILSNVKFISRFALPSKVMRGESGYYFTNLSCALQFIQDMNADSLHMDKEEFEAYTSGRMAVPLRNYEPGRNLSIKAVENGLQMFDALLKEQAYLDDAITAVSKLMEHNAASYAGEIEDFLDSHLSTDVLDFCKTLHDDDVTNVDDTLPELAELSMDSVLKNETGDSLTEKNGDGCDAEEQPVANASLNGFSPSTPTCEVVAEPAEIEDVKESVNNDAAVNE